MGASQRPKTRKQIKRMKQEMLINVAQPEECRIAIVEDGVLEELYIERTSAGQLRRQHLQGQGRQPGAEHPGGVRRLRRRPQRLLAHQRRRAAILSPGRLRSGPAARRRLAGPGRRRPGRRKRRRARRGRSPAAGPPPAPARRPTAHQAADPGHPPPRRRSAGAGHQGRHRHQGPHALHLHQHSRPLPGADAGAGPRGRVAQDRRRRAAPQAARRDARAEPAQGRWASSSAPPASTAPRRSCRATWPTCCGCGRSSSGGSRSIRRRSTSTKKAT